MTNESIYYLIGLFLGAIIGYSAAQLRKIELKPCPRCGDQPWIHRVPASIFAKYFVTCRMCHCCGKTKIGIRRAARSWNRFVKRVEREEDHA